MHWEQMYSGRYCVLRRSGRFLVSELLTPHRVLSTSVRNGGQSDKIRFLVNHQSCEASDHRERQQFISELGLDRYHDAACSEICLDPDEVAMMGTAANMNYAAIVEQQDQELTATAIVTAGVQGNAACAGDPAGWRETEHGWEKIAHTGTINTMLLLNQPLTNGALARAVVTMTEAKSAALQRLAIRSLYSQDGATGTGTDQYCITSPLDGARPLTSTSPHVKLGEIIGTAVRDATLRALQWQNGLEFSYTRSIFHALGRYGVNESNIFHELTTLMSERHIELLQKNSKAVFYEPLVSASAFAMASVLDRVRYGTLPSSAASQALRQQAATLAVSLAAKPECWVEFHNRLKDADVTQPASTVLSAIALGWSSKWH